jgi:hypothetical protein
MNYRDFLVLSIGTPEQLASVRWHEAGYNQDSHLVLRPELNREQQLKVIAEVLDDIGFLASPTPHIPKPPPLVPTQRFAPVEAFYLSKAVQS